MSDAKIRESHDCRSDDLVRRTLQDGRRPRRRVRRCSSARSQPRGRRRDEHGRRQSERRRSGREREDAKPKPPRTPATKPPHLIRSEQRPNDEEANAALFAVLAAVPLVVGSSRRAAARPRSRARVGGARPPRPRPAPAPATATATATPAPTPTSRGRRRDRRAEAPRRHAADDRSGRQGPGGHARPLAVRERDSSSSRAPRTTSVAFSLEDADLAELVRVISQLTGKRFIFGGKVKNIKATVYSPQKVTVAEAYQAFLSILETNGSPSFRTAASSRSSRPTRRRDAAARRSTARRRARRTRTATSRACTASGTSAPTTRRPCSASSRRRKPTSRSTAPAT